jgi:hypothetical protein
MNSRLRIVVTGEIAQHPLLGGVTWFYLQYALGLARLGHDVYYMEDTGDLPYRLDGTKNHTATDCADNAKYLAQVMTRFGFGDQWAYRCPLETRWFGLSGQQLREVLESADLLINVSGSVEHPEEYRRVRRLVYIDTDPVFTQVRLARGEAEFCKWVDAHDVQFSYAECLSDAVAADAVPATRYHWRPTRVPIVLSEWDSSAPYRDVFTTIMNWTSYNSQTYNGRTYGQKNLEFERFLDLPNLVAPTVLELAIGMGFKESTPYELLAAKGWRLVDPIRVCPDIDSLRRYTESSKAEWSVAKQGYVVGQSGWFSERSARYLAAGRPVVVQDTGFTRVLPSGEGILPFRTIEEAASAIQEVEGNYGRHAKIARAIAREYFDSDKVLSRLVQEALCSD